MPLALRRPSLLLPFLLLVACGEQSADAGVPTGGPGGAMPPTPVTVVTLQSQPVTLTRELTGRVASSLVAEVRPQVTGLVKARLFTEGGSVRAGQALYQLDETAFLADRTTAQAQVTRAQAALTTARLQAGRSAELVKSNAISRQDNDNAQAALRQAEAELKAAQAGVQAANVPLGFTRITAPISGRISKSSVTPGALVTAGQVAPLATIQQLDPLYVDVSQSSTELLQFRQEIAAGSLQGADSVPVTITLEDGSAYPHAGRVSFAESMVDPTTGAVALRVVVPNPERLLLPGMFVRAAVANAERRAAILAPQQGITRDAKGNASAMVVDAQGKVEARQVTVSRAIGDHWLVESGLAAGDKLIVEGLQKIKPGAQVQATEQGSQPPAAAQATPAAASGT